MTSPASGTTAPDVVVIGAGIVGVCCALSVLRHGKSVLIVDRDLPGEGASHGNAGVISPWSFIPQSLPGVWKQVPQWLADPQGPLRVDWRDTATVAPWGIRFFREASEQRYPNNADAMARLIAPSIQTYRDFLSDIETDQFIRDSALVSLISGPPPSMDAPTWRLRSERGASIQIVDANELREIEPAVAKSYSGAVILSGQARALSPGHLCKALAEQAQKLGARFTRSAVQSITVDSNGRPTVMLGDGQISTQHVVLAAGPWSASLLQPLVPDLKLPVIGERGYHLEFTEPGLTLNNSVLDPAKHFIVSSMQNGVRAAGTSELSRLDRPPNYQRAELLIEQTRQMIPDINIEHTSPWMGTRATFPDSLPVIGPVPGFERLIAAFGQSHWGMSMAPGTGLLVGAMIAGAKPFTDVSAYRLDRF